MQNQGQAVWSGTQRWVDTVYFSPDPVFGYRAIALGSVVHDNKAGLAAGASYTETAEFTLPAGTDGPYYLHLVVDGSSTPVDEDQNGNSRRSIAKYSGTAYEPPDLANNRFVTTIPVTYRESDLVISNFQFDAAASSGQKVDVSFTVKNQGTRNTREGVWANRIYLSSDASLDKTDLQVGQVISYFYGSGLAAGAEQPYTTQIQIPEGADGSWYLIAYADSDVRGIDLTGPSPTDAGAGSGGLDFDSVKEFRGEGNNVTVKPIAITLRPSADLQVQAGSVKVPERVLTGQELLVKYRVVNAGAGATPPDQLRWVDKVYLSADDSLDVNTDRYLGDVSHEGALAAGSGYYDVTETFRLRSDLVGSYYVFVITDPGESGRPRGAVYEGANEGNNATPSALLLIEQPPPADLIVTDFKPFSGGTVNQDISLSWTVTNQGQFAAQGSWIDSVYLSSDGTWDLGDALLGQVRHDGTIDPTGTYTSPPTSFRLPPMKAGQYRIIVRPDIFNQVYEGSNEGNNTTASANVVSVTVPELQLGVSRDTSLTVGQGQLYKVTVAAGQTLRFSLDTDRADAANEIYVRWNEVPSAAKFDASFNTPLQPDQVAVVPTSQAGDYYVLVRSLSAGASVFPAKVKVEALPFQISNVTPDQGGDGRWVTMTISGAQFKAGAVAKLVRPGISEIEPSRVQVVDATTIVAIFDLRSAPHGLYDVQVINPNGAVAVVPYRYLVERALPIDVTLGLGGTRALSPSTSGLYHVTLENGTNVDTPYVYFQVGVPEMGDNARVLGLPYVSFASNVRGGPNAADDPNAAWASLDSEVNTSGYNLAPGYVLDLQAGGFAGLNFTAQTYPGFAAILALDRVQLRTVLADARPEWITDGTFETKLKALEDLIQLGIDKPMSFLKTMANFYKYMPFRFNVAASATALTRDDFVRRQSAEAEALRLKVVADKTASRALADLASDAETWMQSYLAALEQGGLLRPENQAPPIRLQPRVAGMLAILTSGVTLGRAGQSVQSDGDLVKFFEQVKTWYGDQRGKLAPIASYDPLVVSEDGDERLILVPVPALPTQADANLGLAQKTYLNAFNVFAKGGGNPASAAASAELALLGLQALFDLAASASAQASVTGPSGYGSQQFLPADQPLPYTINFTNASTASRSVNEVRIVQKLDAGVTPYSFRLGDIKLGDVTVHIPAGRASYQGDIDLRNSRGYILRVSAAVDPNTSTASWVLQAIDPLTGEVLVDATRGLLLPDDANGRGQGYVSYSINPKFGVATGQQIKASARVTFDGQGAFDTAEVVHTFDGEAPVTTLTARTLSGNAYDVQWSATDEPGGSGVRHTSIFVSVDGGAWEIWKRQTTETSGVYQGQAGKRYEFAALSTDNAGNRELARATQTLPDDGTRTNLGDVPSAGKTTLDTGKPPTPSNATSTNPLFAEAEKALPAGASDRPSQFTQVLAPFSGAVFGTGIAQSNAGIGPLALLERPDGSFIASGGLNRGSLYVYAQDGGKALNPKVVLDTPVFDLAYDNRGGLWATSGGGQLLELDPTSLAILNRYGDSLTQSLAFDAAKGVFYVSSGDGIETFDIATRRFAHFSDLRVDDLAFAPNGQLWASRWPNRGEIVSFDAQGKPSAQIVINADLDSLTFGRKGTQLEGLLFISARKRSGYDTPVSLYMVDLATLRVLQVASGGPSAEQLLATSDGRLLIANSAQVDVLAPVVAPQVVRTTPANGSLVPLPLSEITVVFDHDMLASSTSALASVINPLNYVLENDGRAVSVRTVSWNSATRTATLRFNSLEPGHLKLTVKAGIRSTQGLTLPQPYEMAFTAMSDFSDVVRLDFTNTRSDRDTGTISFDVRVTNIGDIDLLPPMKLVLDPARYFEGTVPGTPVDGGLWMLDLGLQPVGLKPGQSTVVKTVTLGNPLGQRTDIGAGVYALPYPNAAPFITSTPPTQASVGQPFQYKARAVDTDGGGLRYLLVSGPEGMTLDAISGLLTW
ncbi:MAG: CARDB domain-containing protein, partial [Burkholderiales bacterium]